MAQKHTYCFTYLDIDFDTCYIWIEAINEDVARIKFNDEAPEAIRLLSIRETFNWQ